MNHTPAINTGSKAISLFCGQTITTSPADEIDLYRASKLSGSCCVGSTLPWLAKILITVLAFSTFAITLINIFNNSAFFSELFRS